MLRRYVLFVLMILSIYSLVSCNQGVGNDKMSSFNTKYLNYVTVDKGFSIVKSAEYSGTEYEYVVYELESDDRYSESNYRKVYWVIIVLKDGEVFSVLRQNADENAESISMPTASNLLKEIDVDFNGKNDILLWLGHFGNQGYISYACYLNKGNDFIECPSFSDIRNPAVDAENHVILSSWRNWAASHSYAIYYFIDGEYIEMERLTEEQITTENGEKIWTWTDEIFVNGNWQVREYFTEKDYDKETIYEKVRGVNSHWGIAQDRWRTLFNNGLMLDFSIYD